MKTGKLLCCLLLLASVAEARNLGQLRSRVDWYLNDGSDLMVASAIKDSIINVAQEEYSAEFPIHLDTQRQDITVGTRFYAVPSNYGGQIASMHKVGEKFTELKYVPTDSVPSMQDATLQFFSIKHTIDTPTIILYPRPALSGDTIFYFFHATPAEMTTDSDECRIADYAEEPVVLLAVSKIWASRDLRLDLAQWYHARYVEHASRLARLETESPR